MIEYERIFGSTSFVILKDKQPIEQVKTEAEAQTRVQELEAEQAQTRH